MAFVCGLLIGTVLVPVANRLASTLDIVDRPTSSLAIHDRPVPLLGGLAVIGAAFLGSTMAGKPPSVGLTSGIILVLLIGTADDVYPIPPHVRLFGQSVAGLLLVLDGFRLSSLGPLAEIGMVALVICSANAVNIVDGQDGLAGGLITISGIGLLALSGWNAADPIWTLVLAFVGGLLAFLFWNRPPAQIFLGNGGADSMGIVLAVAVSVLVAAQGWLGFVLAIMCMGTFAFELVFTVLRRLVACKPLMVGDRGHSYDLLAYRVGRNYSTLIFWALGTVGISAAFFLSLIV